MHKQLAREARVAAARNGDVGAGGSAMVPSVGRPANGNAGTFNTALAAAVAGGTRGEAKLMDALQRAPAPRRVLVIAALGEADGPQGVLVLRSIVADRSAPADHRCAGLVALAKREGPAASDVFAACLTDVGAAVRRYALRCLACVGDARAWPAAYRRLRKLLAGPPLTSPAGLDVRTLSAQSETVAAASYLARHVRTAQRQAAVAELIRARWDRLYAAEQEWFETYWPACVPGCSRAVAALRPTPDSVAAWMSHPLLLPLYRPDP